MVIDDIPQSEDVSQELEAPETTTPEVTDIDLGNGIKVSRDVLNEAYDFHNRFSGYDENGDLDETIQESVRLRRWMEANPEKAEEIRQIAMAKAKAEKQDTQRPSPELEEMRNDLTEWKFEKVMGGIQKTLEKSGITWDKSIEHKVLSAIANLNLPDNIKNMDGIVARYVLADLLPNQIANRKSQADKVKKAAFSEGAGGVTRPAKKPVTQMTKEEQTEFMKGLIPDDFGQT